MTEEQLTALLRLKRFEQPPEQYFSRLLQDVHRRQRGELLQRPLWRIALERMQTFFSEHSMGNLSYAGALAVALVVGIGTILVATPGEIEIASGAQSKPKPASLISLETTGVALPAAFDSQIAQPGRVFSAKDRRYVIDARPVSYEPESSIRF